MPPRWIAYNGYISILRYQAYGVSEKYPSCLSFDVPIFFGIPKYRHKVFIEPYRGALKGIIEKVAYDYDIDIVELEIPEDLIHMVVRGIPKMSPSDVMQVIKSISAREFY